MIVIKMIKQIPQGYKQTKVGIIPKDWDVVKLKNISNKVTQKNRDKNINIVLSNSAIDGVVLQGDYFNKDIANKDSIDGYYVVKYGDFIYNPRISKSAPAGPINRNCICDGVVSPLYTVFQINKLIYIDYVEHFFKSTLWFKYMFGCANYGARHDRMSLTNEDFFNLPIAHPPRKEQEKIAEILMTWDEAITKQTELIVQKQLFKKGLMQQIFSQKIRFRDDNGKNYPVWQTKKIGDTLKIKHGKDQKKVALVDGQYPILGTSGEIGRTNSYLCNKPSVLIGRKGTINRPQYMDTPFWTVDTLFYSEVDDNCFAKWMFYKFETIDWLFYNEASGVPSLSATTISNIKLKLPILPEQTKIANFLSLVDDEINILTDELEQLKLQKKALMQKLLTGQIRVIT